MTIRAAVNMPGGNYKPEWQEVSLNIFCWIGMVLGAFVILSVFLTHTQAERAGSFMLFVGAAILLSNLLILQRNDTWMTVTKILHIMNVMRCATCGCLTFGQIGQSYGQTRQVMIFEFVITIVLGIYSAFMAYLLHYEGQT